LDLDAEPSVIDDHLAAAGMGDMTARHPGLRAPGAVDGFEAALAQLLLEPASCADAQGIAEVVVQALGDPVVTGASHLSRIAPAASRVAEAGAGFFSGLGLTRERAASIVAVARGVVSRTLRLERGASVEEAE